MSTEPFVDFLCVLACTFARRTPCGRRMRRCGASCRGSCCSCLPSSSPLSSCTATTHATSMRKRVNSQVSHTVTSHCFANHCFENDWFSCCSSQITCLYPVDPVDVIILVLYLSTRHCLSGLHSRGLRAAMAVSCITSSPHTQSRAYKVATNNGKLYAQRTGCWEHSRQMSDLRLPSWCWRYVQVYVSFEYMGCRPRSWFRCLWSPNPMHSCT